MTGGGDHNDFTDFVESALAVETVPRLIVGDIGLYERKWRIQSQGTSLSEEQKAAVARHIRDFGRTPLVSTVMHGEAGVGRKSLRHRLQGDSFTVPPRHEYDPTGDPSIFRIFTNIENHWIYFDGTLGYPTMTWKPQSLPFIEVRHCEVYLLVYDVTKRDTFDAVTQYYENMNLERGVQHDVCSNHCSPCPPRPPFRDPIFVIANKIDCEKIRCATTLKEGREFASSIGAMFFAMSAKTGEGGGTDVLLFMAYYALLRRIEKIEKAKISSKRETLMTRNEDFWN